jgi:hypothetical protein
MKCDSTALSENEQKDPINKRQLNYKDNEAGDAYYELPRGSILPTLAKG